METLENINVSCQKRGQTAASECARRRSLFYESPSDFASCSSSPGILQSCWHCCLSPLNIKRCTTFFSLRIQFFLLNYYTNMALVKDLEEYECPLCMEKLVPPVFQCPSGHLFCKKCIGNYITCPTCKRPTVLQDPAGGHIKNLEIERIIRDYQTHQCPWTGCLKRVKLDNLESHKLGCIKR